MNHDMPARVRSQTFESHGPTADHVLLTRFNLPSAGAESLIRAESSWLRDRVKLFEHYCLPSVAAQTRTDLTWLIYFDIASPDWLHAWITHAQQIVPFRALLRTEVSNAGLIQDLRAAVPQRHDFLITTNLDNDDALAIDFSERLRLVDLHPGARAVYLVNGIIASGDRSYLRRDRHNAFASVIETWDLPETCWAEWHNLLPALMPTVEIGGAPGWLQVIHGGNVSNRVRGRLTDPRPYDGLFPGLLTASPGPGRQTLLRDALLDCPARGARDILRAAAKSTLMQLVGKEGLDRWKTRLAGARRQLAPTRGSGDAHVRP